MPENVTINEQDGIIQIDFYGSVHETDLNQSFMSVLMIVEEKGLNKVLVNATRQTSLSPSAMDLQNFILKLSIRARNMKHAVVASTQTFESLYFLEAVSVARGVNLQIFSSHNTALAWLKD